jgi:Fe-S cluster biosynthesis and repair protein YggX
MGELLTKLGAPVPEVKKSAAEAAAPTGGFMCRKSGRPGTQMDRPPFRGPLGAWIAGNISRETFNDGIAQGTKVINELRLDLSRDDHAETYDQHMREYLGIDDEVLTQIHSRPERP